MSRWGRSIEEIRLDIACAFGAKETCAIVGVRRQRGIEEEDER